MRPFIFLGLALLCISISGAFMPPTQSPIGLAKGDYAPDFTARTISGKEVHLGSMVKTGNIVLLFYQGFWCEGCHKSLSHFREELSKITQKGGHTIAITPTPFTGSPNSRQETDPDVSIVVDQDLSIMRSFGIISDAPEEYVRANHSYGSKDFSFIPATYIIDENQQVKFAHVDPSFTINAFVDSLLIHN